MSARCDALRRLHRPIPIPPPFLSTLDTRSAHMMPGLPNTPVSRPAETPDANTHMVNL